MTKCQMNQKESECHFLEYWSLIHQKKHVPFMTTEKGTECVHFWFKQYFIHNLLHVILYNTVTYIIYKNSEKDPEESKAYIICFLCLGKLR